MREGLGELQLQVMEIVWQRGSATVAEVHEELGRTRALAYTTALSTLRGLERRGHVSHTREGRAHRFHARVSREDYTRQRVDRLVSTLFSGQAEKLMSHLLGSETLDPKTLGGIRRLLEDEDVS